MSDPSGAKDGQEAELYRFDCRGFLIFRRYMSPEQVSNACNDLSRLNMLRDDWHEGQWRSSNIHVGSGLLAALGQSLYHHPLSHLTIGYPHRLLESYALSRDCGALDLHGGASEFLRGVAARDISARSWTHDGRSYALRVKVLIYLDDVVGPDDGRFAYVEGSHKAALSFHRAFPGGRREAADLVRTVKMRAGDALWLNEALLHGAERKTSSAPRRLLAYTFGPTFMASWSEVEQESISASGYVPTETEAQGEVGSDG